MKTIRIEGTEQRLRLPESIEEVTLGQALAIKEKITPRQLVAILSGASVDELSGLSGQTINALVSKHLLFISQMPDFTAMPLPDQIKVGGFTIQIAGRLFEETGFGEPFAAGSEVVKLVESQATRSETIVALLTIYLFSPVTGFAFESTSKSLQIAPELLGAPCTQLLPIGEAILSRSVGLANFEMDLKQMRERARQGAGLEYILANDEPPTETRVTSRGSVVGRRLKQLLKLAALLLLILL